MTNSVVIFLINWNPIQFKYFLTVFYFRAANLDWNANYSIISGLHVSCQGSARLTLPHSRLTRRRGGNVKCQKRQHWQNSEFCFCLSCNPQQCFRSLSFPFSLSVSPVMLSVAFSESFMPAGLLGAKAFGKHSTAPKGAAGYFAKATSAECVCTCSACVCVCV